MKNTLDIKSTLRQCWGQFREVAQTENRPELVERYEPEMKRFELGLFRIVVMGEIKKGKSSFINALLGAPDLLPVASDVATSVVFKVIYGPERKFKVFFQQDMDTGKRPEPLEITQEQLCDYGTESGNPGNKKRVDFIGVEEPNPMLAEGSVLIDTPCVGGMFKAHHEVSWRYAPNADAIFFVLDSVEAVMSRDEVTFLKELKNRLKKQVFFVQTKIDAVDLEQSESWRERNKSILEQKVGLSPKHIQYFPISSELKNAADESHDGPLLEESGFLTLLDFIHRGLKAQKEKMLAAHIATLLALPLNEIHSDLQSQVRMLQTKSGEEIRKIQTDLQQAKTDFAKWERSSYPQQVQEFRNDFEEIKKKYRRIIQETMDPNGRIVTGLINEIRELDFEPQEFVAQSEQIQQIWLSDVLELFGNIQREYNDDIVSLCGRMATSLQQATESMDVVSILGNESSAEAPLVNVDKVSMSFSTFESLRTNLYGGMAGGTMAVIAAGIVSFIFPPAGFLTIVAPWVGGWFGSIWSVENMVQRQREEFLAKLKQQLQALSAQISRYAMNHFDDLGNTYERKINEFFREIIENHRRRLEEQNEQAQLAISRSREDNIKQLEGVKIRSAKVTHLLQQLAALLPDQKNY